MCLFLLNNILYITIIFNKKCESVSLEILKRIREFAPDWYYPASADTMSLLILSTS